MKYSSFNEVNDPTLRAWNRINTIFNIKEHVGNAVATKYAAKFNKADKVAIMVMSKKIKTDGYENTRREIIRNNNAKG